MVISRVSADDGHVLISGTGRAGTTFLVQYFTALGFDTGYELDDALSRVDPISHAGLERTVNRGGGLAYVSKSPHFMKSLRGHLDNGAIKVKCVIVPMRDLRDAAESRRDVARRAREAGKDDGDGAAQRGSLAFGAKRLGPASQERVLAIQFHRLVETLALYRIPMYLLHFPEFVRSAEVLWQGLEPVLVEHGVTRAESDAAVARTSRPELVSDFGSNRDV